MINGKVVEQYNKHGVSVVRDCISEDWLTVLRDAVEQDIQDPGPYVHRYESDDGQGRFHGNLRLWETNSRFRDFCLNSRLPEIAAQLLGSAKVNLLYDQLFVKEPGTPNRTRWHNDQPYWAMRGWQVLTFWIALDPVNCDSGAMEFLRGSHRWDRWFQPEIFGKGPGIEPYERNPDYEPIPDIEQMRDSYDIVSWDLSPGDVYVFHALTVHGAGGNLTTDVRRRGYAVRYTGDDVVYCERPGTNKGLRSAEHADGDPLDSSRYPVVWREERPT